jgi:AraC-like DNA-binding protein
VSASSTARPGAIAGRVLVRVTDFVAARGHDPEALCRRVGLRLAALHEPESRIPYGLAEELGALAAEWTGDENFGLHLAGTIGQSMGYDAGALLLMASPTVRAGLERMLRFQRYWGDGDRARLVRAKGGLSLRYVLPGPPSRHSDECALAEVVLGVRALSGQDVVPRAVRFRHAAPADTREHAAIFRAPIAFEAPHTELELDDAALDLRLPHATEAFSAIFEAQVQRALARLPGESGTTGDVVAAARATLGAGECTLERTARALGMSERTLQRRLREAGTTFAAIVDSIRREMAVEYLDKRMPVTEIAFLLGYAEPSAFHHAFKRWTGTTPERARAQR